MLRETVVGYPSDIISTELQCCTMPQQQLSLLFCNNAKKLHTLDGCTENSGILVYFKRSISNLCLTMYYSTGNLPLRSLLAMHTHTHTHTHTSTNTDQPATILAHTTYVRRRCKQSPQVFHWQHTPSQYHSDQSQILSQVMQQY